MIAPSRHAASPRRGWGARALSVALVGAALVAACKKTPPPPPTPDPTPSASGPVAVTPAEAAPDPARGKALVLEMQCNRCHDGTGHAAAAQNKHCVHCHKDIMEGRFKASEASIARWKPRVKDLADAPSLEAIGARVSRAFIESYLLTPTDLRPHLVASMPRLAITSAQAKDIAAYLAPEDAPPAAREKAPAAIAGADLGKGRALLDSKGCGTCHTFSGIAPLTASPVPVPQDPRAFERGHRIAPDLRATRDRMSAARVVRWLKDPKAVKADTEMPTIPLTDAEIRDLAAYVLTVPLASPEAKPKPERLPLLTRRVSFKEVDEKVFHRTCWHCHSEPDYAIGDGGPGNSGGLGFKPRGLNLSDYAGIAAGFLDDKGERSSVFAKEADGTPRLVRAMLARHEEEAGAPTGPVRGMPLGYAPISLEDIQLVDTWISQGRPR